MRFERLQHLLDANPDDIALAEFAGAWDLLSFRNALSAAQSELRQIDFERTRLLIEALKRRFPFDYRTACKQTGVPREEALRGLFGETGNPNPTPFIPVVLFALAVDGVSVHVSEDDLTMLAGYAVAAIAQLDTPETGNTVAAAALLNDICRVLRDHGQLELAVATAEQAVAQARKSRTVPTIALADLYDALYDARADRHDRDAPVSDAERLVIAREMLAFIDGELTPAIRARNTLFQTSANPEIREAVTESELALSHRRLTWETAESASARGWPTDATTKWIKLAEDYRAIGRLTNAANALSAAVDELIVLVEANAPLAAELDVVLREFSGILQGAPWRTEAHRRELLRRVTLAELALRRTPSADTLRAIASSIEVELRRADDVHRDFVLSTADDYLGLFLRAFGPGHEEFKALFELIRGMPLPPPATIEDAMSLRLFVTRFGSGIHVSTVGSDAELIHGEEAHDLAKTLSAVARRVRKDIRECLDKKVVPESAPEWSNLLGRLEGQVGLTRLGRTRPTSPKRVVVELDGLVVHIPIAGPLLDLWHGVEAIALTRLGFTSPPSVLATAASVRILSGFKKNEPWGLALQRLANYLGVKVECFATPEELRTLLSSPGSLIVIGAHGHQDGVAGALHVEVGPEVVPVTELFRGVQLSVGATVLCATCFAGSGEGLSLHGWKSMPECLLLAGARSVVANRWPAWTEPQTEREFFAYVAALRAASIATCPWAVPTQTTAFAKLLRNRYKNPRQWAGWGAWVASHALENA